MNREGDKPDTPVDVYRRIFMGTMAGSGVSIGLGLPLLADAETNTTPSPAADPRDLHA